MNKKVIIYSAPWCSGCQTLKGVLMKNGINYTEVDLDTPTGSITARENNIRSLPTTVVDSKVFIGSSEEVLNKILKEVS